MTVLSGLGVPVSLSVHDAAAADTDSVLHVLGSSS